jgi:signal transduction histidine kinase
VTQADLVERLASHRTIGSAPREQLEWLAAHGELRRYSAGDVVVRVGEPVRDLIIVLRGRFGIRIERGGVTRKVMEWRAGDVGGCIPFSRLQLSPGHSTVEEDAEMLAVDKDCFPELVSRCYEMTALFVHVMLDRARRFTSSDFQVEKMVSLGRLSAGLAHELNNPASAVARSAPELSARLNELEASALALGSLRLTAEQLAAIAKVRTQCDSPAAWATLSPLERSDREDAIDGWLRGRGMRNVSAADLCQTALTVEGLDQLATSLGKEPLEFALKSIGARHRTNTLASEIAIASRRIHDLVAAIKGFTYMDQSRVPRPVVIGKGLADTIAMYVSNAKAKSVIVTLDVPPDLPEIEGLGGELNQVWSNLIGNAIDAVAESGHVQVSAGTKGDKLVVRVVDDGPGVPEELQEKIFEPFFTTKPVGSGTGLGLDIARRVVYEHDGEIEMDSRPGRTEFRVLLPLRRA